MNRRERRIVTLPVSGSTSTSTITPENEPPTPRGFTARDFPDGDFRHAAALIRPISE
jgi:hypothetical protein